MNIKLNIHATLDCKNYLLKCFLVADSPLSEFEAKLFKTDGIYNRIITEDYICYVANNCKMPICYCTQN